MKPIEATFATGSTGMVLGILLFLLPLHLFQCVLPCLITRVYLVEILAGFSSHPVRHPCGLCAFKPELGFRRSLGDHVESQDATSIG